VISGLTRVSEAARDKMLDAIRVLKYQPNLIVRSLRTNRTHTLGIVVPDLTIPFFPKIVRRSRIGRDRLGSSRPQEWKPGVESDKYSLYGRFNDTITDFSLFDQDTPATFRFAGDRPDLEPSAFVQDLICLDQWTVSAALRWDHYQLLVNQNALSPRLGVSRHFPGAELVVHASYDRAFQTPKFENILLSSSPDVVPLSDQVLRLPVPPPDETYYELGFTKGFFRRDRTVRSCDYRSSEFRPGPRQTQSVAQCLCRRGFGEDGQIHCAASR
jgi:hypothetical protein